MKMSELSKEVFEMVIYIFLWYTAIATSLKILIISASDVVSSRCSYRWIDIGCDLSGTFLICYGSALTKFHACEMGYEKFGVVLEFFILVTIVEWLMMYWYMLKSSYQGFGITEKRFYIIGAYFVIKLAGFVFLEQVILLKLIEKINLNGNWMQMSESLFFYSLVSSTIYSFICRFRDKVVLWEKHSLLQKSI